MKALQLWPPTPQLSTRSSTAGSTRSASSTPAAIEHSIPLEYQQLLDLWLLVDYLVAPAAKDVAIDLLRLNAGLEWTRCYGRIPFIYDNTHAGSPLRKFAVDMVLTTRSEALQGDWIRELAQLDDCPFEFVADLVLGCLKLRAEEWVHAAGGWILTDKCEHHDHLDVCSSTDRK